MRRIAQPHRAVLLGRDPYVAHPDLQQAVAGSAYAESGRRRRYSPGVERKRRHSGSSDLGDERYPAHDARARIDADQSPPGRGAIDALDASERARETAQGRLDTRGPAHGGRLRRARLSRIRRVQTGYREYHV